MSTFLQFMGIIARFTHSSEEVWCAYLAGADLSIVPTVTGITSDARTAIFAHFRYMGLDVEMDRMYAGFRERSSLQCRPYSTTL